MKINWKVRLKNPVFWMTIIPATVAFAYQILSLIGVVPCISQDILVNSLSAIVSALATLGVLVDPTTIGLSDSAQAMTYETPKKESN
jgi:holin, phage phi LC3 family